MSPDPDRELLYRCQTVGSEEFEATFRLLYDRYRDKVYSVALRITGNASDASDAAQDAFVLLYRNLSSFKFDSKFSSWLYRLVINASIDHLRRTRSRGEAREHALGLDDSLSISDEAQLGPLATAERKDRAELIQAGIQKLSEKLRIIIVLRYQQNQSYAELAEILGISIGTVKSRLNRGHIALLEHLKGISDLAQHYAEAGPGEGK